MHNPGREPLRYLTLGQLAADAARRYGQRDAVVSVEEGVRLSFRDVLEQSDRLAAGLRRLGLQRGDRVAIWGPNSWRWVVAKIAIARAGFISVGWRNRARACAVQDEQGLTPACAYCCSRWT